jgi:hypothetical protein
MRLLQAIFDFNCGASAEYIPSENIWIIRIPIGEKMIELKIKHFYKSVSPGIARKLIRAVRSENNLIQK